jgi:prepilin-type N-terminal cleavage/methylation domain-containing protein
MRDKNQNLTAHNKGGFTLIELLVVIAIIALLTSIALIAFMSARQKSRDAKRLSDMTQMNTALELYFATNKGYPSSSTGIPSPLVPSFASSLPSAPQPADGSCGVLTYGLPVPAGTYGSGYYYYPSGTAYFGSDGTTSVYPDYAYYFCLGNQTGNFSSGLHILTPEGVR